MSGAVVKIREGTATVGDGSGAWIDPAYVKAEAPRQSRHRKALRCLLGAVDLTELYFLVIVWCGVLPLTLYGPQ